MENWSPKKEIQSLLVSIGLGVIVALIALMFGASLPWGQVVFAVVTVMVGAYYHTIIHDDNSATPKSFLAVTLMAVVLLGYTIWWHVTIRGFPFGHGAVNILLIGALIFAAAFAALAAFILRSKTDHYFSELSMRQRIAETAIYSATGVLVAVLALAPGGQYQL